MLSTFGVGDLKMLIEKSGRSIVVFSLTLASKTLRIHQLPTFIIAQLLDIKRETVSVDTVSVVKFKVV